MSEPGKSSIRINNDAAAKVAVWLLAHYYFDLRGYEPCELVESWLNQYPGNWLRLAVIEALYQGRYKAVSVEQILIIWHRRNQALYHFNYEFESLICSKLPPELTQLFSTDISNPNPPEASFSSPPFTCCSSDWEGTEKSAPASYPVEVFTQSPPSSGKSSLPRVATVETLPKSFSSDLEEEYHNAIALEETTASGYIESDRTNTYPFPDLFTKLKALALQHQQLINQQQLEM